MPKLWTNSGVDLYLEVPPGRGRRAALENALRQAIREGRLPCGERLPSTRALAEQLGLARGTVVQAYEQLIAEGYLRARPGAVTEVAHAPGIGPGRGADPPKTRIVADFRWGLPDLSSFPRNEWLRAMRRALQTTAHRELGQLDPRGSLRLRTALASYLGRVRGVLCTPEQIVICSGFAQGLRLICDALTAQGASTIGMEDPCHADHRAIAAAAGLHVAAIEVDQEGACPTPAATAADAVVLTAAHQTPLGSTLASRRRAEFVRSAIHTGSFIVEDDYDGEFRYDRHPVGALQGLAPEHVIYAGSTSKSLAPGLRLGWLVVPDSLLDAVMTAKRRADRGTDALAQHGLAEMIEAGALDRHVRRMRLRYRRRRDALVTMLNQSAPDMALQGIAAGLHVVLDLPPGVADESEVLAAARQQSIALTPLGPFWHDNTGRSVGLVLGYGTPYEHEYSSALAHLGQFIRAIA